MRRRHLGLWHPARVVKALAAPLLMKFHPTSMGKNTQKNYTKPDKNQKAEIPANLQWPQNKWYFEKCMENWEKWHKPGQYREKKTSTSPVPCCSWAGIGCNKIKFQVCLLHEYDNSIWLSNKRSRIVRIVMILEGFEYNKMIQHFLTFASWYTLQNLTANAPENRPSLPQQVSGFIFQSHQFSERKC